MHNFGIALIVILVLMIGGVAALVLLGILVAFVGGIR
jgi:hypothetical protein